MSEIKCARCGIPAISHSSGNAQTLTTDVDPAECYLAVQHRNTLELFEDLFAVINLVRLANAREVEARAECVEIARRAARATTGYTKTTALFIAQRIAESGER